MDTGIQVDLGSASGFINNMRKLTVTVRRELPLTVRDSAQPARANKTKHRNAAMADNLLFATIADRMVLLVLESGSLIAIQWQ